MLLFRKECRKGVEYKDPYVAHPMRNALRIARWYEREHSAILIDTAIAAILHDTVEDAPGRILKFYGKDIPESEEDARTDSLICIGIMFDTDVHDALSHGGASVNVLSSL